MYSCTNRCTDRCTDRRNHVLIDVLMAFEYFEFPYEQTFHEWSTKTDFLAAAEQRNNIFSFVSKSSKNTRHISIKCQPIDVNQLWLLRLFHFSERARVTFFFFNVGFLAACEPAKLQWSRLVY